MDWKSDEALKALIEKGKQSGSLTYDEVNQALPETSEPDRLPDLLELLEQHGITLIEAEDVAAAVCAFPSLTEAVTCVAQTMQLGIPMARIEFMDPMAMRAINLDMGSAYPEEPHLMIEFNGSPDAVRANAEAFGEIAAEHGGKGFQWASTLEDCNRLWEARHASYWATLKLRPGATGVVKVVEDADRGVLVGATVVGPAGGEIIGFLAVAVHAAVPVATLQTMIYAYPTFHRAIETALGELA